MKHTVVAAFVCLVLAACSGEPFLDRWTIERAETAPWVDASFTPDPTEVAIYVGQTVTFAPTRIEAPALLACDNPNYKFVDVPAAGIFQGGLSDDPAIALTRAKALGFGANIATVQTACEHDISFHMRDADHAAFALDNMIYWMMRAR